jgi:small neutral amino acid transporter SnatA (MarC family)
MEEELPRMIMAKGSGSSGHLLNSTLSDEAQFIPLNLGFIVGEIAISSTFTLALSKGG